MQDHIQCKYLVKWKIWKLYRDSVTWIIEELKQHNGNGINNCQIRIVVHGDVSIVLIMVPIE